MPSGLQNSLVTPRVTVILRHVSGRTERDTGVRGSWLALICLVMAWPVASAAGEAVPPLATWGSFGSDPGQFKYPTGIAVDGNGYVYVADHGNNRVQKFTDEGTFVLAWGTPGSTDGAFDGLSCIAIGPDGSVYTTERVNQRVQKFTSTGTFVAKWGSFGSCDGQFEHPGGIAVDADGNVYVSDEQNYRIQKFTNGGAFLTKWGSWDSPCGGDFEGGLAAGHLHVAANGNILMGSTRAVMEFSASGSLVREWDCCDGGTSEFSFASGIGQSGDGNLYVGAALRNKVGIFSSAGVFLGEFGSAGTGEGQFDFPGAIAANSRGVYVCDLRNHRIQKVAVGGATPIKASTWGRIKTIYR